jgi:hypothetical protein
MTPHARPPVRPGITQVELSRIRDAAERGVGKEIAVQAAEGESGVFTPDEAMKLGSFRAPRPVFHPMQGGMVAVVQRFPLRLPHRPQILGTRGLGS